MIGFDYSNHEFISKHGAIRSLIVVGFNRACYTRSGKEYYLFILILNISYLLDPLSKAPNI